MTKKLIGIFLLIVLAIQVLPVMQVGALLCSNQLTEEVPHSVEKSEIKKIESKSDFLLTFFHIESIYLQTSTNNYLHYSDDIPNNHSNDILVPPSNC